MIRLLGFALLALAAAIAWMVVLPAASIVQPLAFNHVAHSGAACVLCHDGVKATPRARFPAGAVCASCHASPPASVSAAAWRSVELSSSQPWVAVTRLPDHVMFSHQRHVALARLDCVSCHGDVAKRTRPPARAQVRIDMQTCLSCHRREGVSEDCAGCHR